MNLNISYIGCFVGSTIAAILLINFMNHNRAEIIKLKSFQAAIIHCSREHDFEEHLDCENALEKIIKDVFEKP